MQQLFTKNLFVFLIISYIIIFFFMFRRITKTNAWTLLWEFRSLMRLYRKRHPRHKIPEYLNSLIRTDDDKTILFLYFYVKIFRWSRKVATEKNSLRFTNWSMIYIDVSADYWAFNALIPRCRSCIFFLNYLFSFHAFLTTIFYTFKIILFLKCLTWEEMPTHYFYLSGEQQENIHKKLLIAFCSKFCVMMS